MDIFRFGQIDTYLEISLDFAKILDSIGQYPYIMIDIRSHTDSLLLSNTAIGIQREELNQPKMTDKK